MRAFRACMRILAILFLFSGFAMFVLTFMMAYHSPDGRITVAVNESGEGPLEYAMIIATFALSGGFVVDELLSFRRRALKGFLAPGEEGM